MTKQATTKKTSKTTKAGQGSEAIVEGLGETSKREMAERLAELQRKKAKADKAAKEIEGRRARLVDLAHGTNETGKNPKGRHNPALLPNTLRASAEGELVNGRPAKGWVVEIACLTCSEHRTVNTQDAFQVRYCETHKDEARKAKAKERREAAKTAKLEQLDPEELAAQIAAIESELGEAAA